jgi:Secretion system C-terminal sorting domain
MKKIYTLIATLAVVLSANAQVKQVNGAPEKATTTAKLQAVTNLSNFVASPSNSRAYSGWLNYALQLDDPAGFTPGAATADFMLVFPDSTPIAGQYTSGLTARPQFHKVATMLDPKNMPVIGIAATDAYSLDSIGIVYGYLRNLTSSVVDTLRVNIFKDVAANVYTLSSSETYQDITYDYVTDKVTASEIIATYDYYLTDADSSSSAAELFIKTTIPTQAAGKRIGAIVTFKPGYSYTLTDSIVDLNSFYVLSYEQNGLGTAGTGTDPVFNGTTTDATSDLNVSYALPTSVRYNFNTNGWNGYFIPTWAWTTPFADEHHIIEFKISAPPVGINEFVNGAKLLQNMPNPASSNTVISYQLEKNASVALNVFDVTGKLVASQIAGEQRAGSHSIDLNVANLAVGVYHYSLTINNTSTSAMKMVVIK